ncbi:MAG TPA: MFS transporter [Candidatus Paceibacterota bacterium]|nr:MFS transporter [Candidatus Paceibacterota bacterium]
MSDSKKSMFVTDDGKNVTFTFILVTSLFLLWGFCNGMIDVMDKHFQDQLHLTKAQSAWVQFAHYMGYTLMALPAGLLTRRFGYKGGILFGLVLVSLGGFWFMPATHISAFWAFLLGVCLIAMGLTVLETVANPYTTVLGPKERGPARINLAQSFNGIGWILGPIVGGAYFYSDGGVEVAHGRLYIPYLGIAIIVLILAVIFFFANVPDIRTEDAYHTDDNLPLPDTPAQRAKEYNRILMYCLMFLNVCVLGFAAYMILHLILPACSVSEENTARLVPIIVGLPLVVAGLMLVPIAKSITFHNIWAHPHFSSATLSQFLYVAAQAGIFSFFINYIISEMPAISRATMDGWLISGNAVLRDGAYFVNEKGATRLLGCVGFVLFCLGRFVGAAVISKAPAHRVLGTYAFLNVLLCSVVVLKLGWISVIAVFLTFFFMSVMFPTIFALGIHGLGTQSRKKASAFIVMSITGGALMPKLMGHLGDIYNMSVSFWMPLVCFALIALYGFTWSKLSQSEGIRGLKTSGGH